MYTGLIEEIGEISGLKKADKSLYLTVKASKITEGLKIGDSVGINGACQTVVECSPSSFTVFASNETLEVTTFNDFKIGTKVNLEKTMRLSDRLDGHLVSGHVDGTAAVKSVQKAGEAYDFIFEADSCFFTQIVIKGSITIDGISLTIADVSGCTFKVTVIPHTYKSTTLQYLKSGDRVNIETDMIAKYVEKYLSSNHNNSNIDMNLLERNGFL